MLKAMSLGASQYLRKPVDLHALEAALRRAARAAAAAGQGRQRGAAFAAPGAAGGRRRPALRPAPYRAAAAVDRIPRVRKVPQTPRDRAAAGRHRLPEQ
ncbi:MAG: hypothetical protein U1F67_24465 [Rubrivivax sp.]